MSVESCLIFLTELPQDKVLYSKEQARLFNLFVNPSSIIGKFINKVYKIECKGIIIDPTKQNTWLINNVSYFHDIGNSIRIMRNKLAHSESPMVCDIVHCCQEILSFNPSVEKVGSCINEVIRDYTRIIRIPFNKRFITIHEPIPGSLLGDCIKI